jgi:hypothetical protein
MSQLPRAGNGWRGIGGRGREREERKFHDPNSHVAKCWRGIGGGRRDYYPPYLR